MTKTLKYVIFGSLAASLLLGSLALGQPAPEKPDLPKKICDKNNLQEWKEYVTKDFDWKEDQLFKRFNPKWTTKKKIKDAFDKLSETVNDAKDCKALKKVIDTEIKDGKWKRKSKPGEGDDRPLSKRFIGDNLIEIAEALGATQIQLNVIIGRQTPTMVAPYDFQVTEELDDQRSQIDDGKQQRVLKFKPVLERTKTFEVEPGGSQSFILTDKYVLTLKGEWPVDFEATASDKEDKAYEGTARATLEQGVSYNLMFIPANIFLQITATITNNTRMPLFIRQDKAEGK